MLPATVCECVSRLILWLGRCADPDRRLGKSLPHPYVQGKLPGAAHWLVVGGVLEMAMLLARIFEVLARLVSSLTKSSGVIRVIASSIRLVNTHTQRIDSIWHR